MPEIIMPRLSDTMEEGTLSRWFKREGDMVRRGDVIAEIETDKASMELEAYDEGRLTRILVQEGDTVPIGTPVAVIGDGEPEPPAGEAPPAEAEPEERAEPAAEAGAPAAAPPPEREGEAAPRGHAVPPQAPPGRGPGGRVPTSPLARRIAREHGIDITTVKGSGPGGRIVRADVEAAIARRDREKAAPPPAAPTERPAEPAAAPAGRGPIVHETEAPSLPEDADEVPLNRMRRLTAQRLTRSVQEAPHFYLTSVVDAEPLLAYRAELNATLADRGPKISVTDLILKACAVMLREHRALNASWAETRILRHHRVNLGLAVALDDGLIVPVIHDADRKTLTEIANEAHDLAQRARTGRLTLDELAGGTFTVSNLGPFGIDHFTAVINPPQAAILAVGAAKPQPVVRDGEVRPGVTMALTLSIDHRVLDGATGAAFLADLKTLLEQPVRIVV
jgi:pyruvate dehydrogenase E2 component (dihydrolipoamide acetyltransferase)